MTVTLAIVKSTALLPNGHLVQWSLTGATASGAYVFAIDRAGGLEGPWDTVAHGLTNQYAYVDRFDQPVNTVPFDVLRPNQLRFFKNFYYRVRATLPDGTYLEAREEAGPIVAGKMAQYIRKARRDLLVRLRKFEGTPVALLKRRQWGVRCQDCTDRQTKEIIRAACRTCWGTSFVGGYWTPVLSYATRNAGTNTTAIRPEGKSDSSDAKIVTIDVPTMERDDVIVFLDDQRRYRIDQQAETQIRLEPVQQVLSAQEFDHSHVIYKLPVRIQDVKPLY